MRDIPLVFCGAGRKMRYNMGEEMRNIVPSGHAKDMLRERDIPEEWMWHAIDAPDHAEIGTDNNMHYIKAIPEHGGRFLRVIVNHHATPKRVVTLFFDRRLGR